MQDAVDFHTVGDGAVENQIVVEAVQMPGAQAGATLGMALAAGSALAQSLGASGATAYRDLHCRLFYPIASRLLTIPLATPACINEPGRTVGASQNGLIDPLTEHTGNDRCSWDKNGEVINILERWGDLQRSL